MTKEEILKFRDQACNGAVNLIVTCDNMIIYSNTSEFLIWDDDNECLYAIRANTDHYNQDQCSMEVSCTKYDNIQYIEGLMSSDNLKQVLDNFFVSSGLVSEDLKQKIIEYTDSINNHLL